jgi:hypothetical protein
VTSIAHRRVFWFVALAALPAAACGSKRSIDPDDSRKDSALLAYRFTPGRSLTYRMLVSQTYEVRNVEGGPTRLESRVDMDLTSIQQVLDANPTGARLRVSFPKAAVTMRGPRADSAGHLENVVRQTEFVARVDGRGKVVEAGPTDAAPTNVKTLYPALGQALAGLGAVFPAEPKAPGARWQDTQPLNLQMPGGDVMKGSLIANYGFNRWVRVNGRPAAEIGVQLTLSMVPGTMRVPMEGKGSGAGYLYLSTEEGVLVASDVTFVSKGVYNLGGGQYNFAGGAVLEQTVEHRVTTDLVP